MFLEEISKMMLVTVQSNDYVKNIAIFGLVFFFCFTWDNCKTWKELRIEQAFNENKITILGGFF